MCATSGASNGGQSPLRATGLTSKRGWGPCVVQQRCSGCVRVAARVVPFDHLLNSWRLYSAIYLTDLYQGLLYPSSNDLTYGLLHISVSIHYSNKGPLYEVAQMDGEKLSFIVAGSDWKFIEPSCFYIRRWHPSNLYYRLRKIHTSHLLRQRR